MYLSTPDLSQNNLFQKTVKMMYAPSLWIFKPLPGALLFFQTSPLNWIFCAVPQPSFPFHNNVNNFILGLYPSIFLKYLLYNAVPLHLLIKLSLQKCNPLESWENEIEKKIRHWFPSKSTPEKFCGSSGPTGACLNVILLCCVETLFTC